MARKLYIVSLSYVEDYESFEVSYHLTKKGAYRWIIRQQYENWLRCRYVYGYDELFYSIREGKLLE